MAKKQSIIKDSTKVVMRKAIIALLVIAGLLSTSSVFAETNLFSITDVSTKEKTDTTIVNSITYEDLSINSDIIFHEVGDYIIYEIGIKNNTEENYTLKSMTATSDNDFITYTSIDCKNITIPAEGEIKVQLKATYTKKLKDIEARSQEEEFELQLEVQDKKGNILNPQTGDNIKGYISLVLTSTMGLIAIIIMSKKNNKKARVAVISIVLIAAMVVPVAVMAASSVVTIKFTSKIQLLDRFVLTTNEDGTENQIILDYNEEVTLPDPSVEITGYSFDGWYDEDGNKVESGFLATEDISLYALYAPIDYAITYELDGGTVEGNPETYNIDSEEIKLLNPTKEGYIFAGWTGTDLEAATDDVTIANGSTGDREYTANWTIIDYTITYTLNGGDEVENPTTYNVESEAIDLVNPTKTGYTFAGWTGTELETATEKVTIPTGSTGDREYTATWTPIEYTITYNLDDGTAENPTTYTIESDDITLSEPTKSGFTFDGWTGDNGENPQKEVTIPSGSMGDKTFTANWTEIVAPSVTAYRPGNYESYTPFSNEWRTIGGSTTTYPWPRELPCLVFENDVTSARMSFSSTHYITDYSYREDSTHGSVSVSDKTKMWFDNGYGYLKDGYYLVNYYSNSVEHEFRFRIESYAVVDFEMLY